MNKIESGIFGFESKYLLVMIRVFVLGCFLTVSVVASDTSDASDQIEDFIPLLFPNRFFLHGRNSSIETIVFSLARNSNGFVKGYSLKIPNRKLLALDYPKEIERKARTKRAFFNLYNVVSCTTGCNPLMYKGYGCFCGFLGSGYPVDEIDSCCQIHDLCYDNANCPMPYLEYFIPYYWKCQQGRSVCASNQGIFGGQGSSCARKICECDRALSDCLQSYQCPSKQRSC